MGTKYYTEFHHSKLNLVCDICLGNFSWFNPTEMPIFGKNQCPYHDYWWCGSLCCQVINNQNINYVEYPVPWIPTAKLVNCYFNPSNGNIYFCFLKKKYHIKGSYNAWLPSHLAESPISLLLDLINFAHDYYKSYSKVLNSTGLNDLYIQKLTIQTWV